MLNLVNPSLSVRPEEIRLSLDEIAREGARRMLIAALNAESGEYVERFQNLRDDNGHRMVVRHGKAEPRNVTLGSGTIEVQAPYGLFLKDFEQGTKVNTDGLITVVNDRLEKNGYQSLSLPKDEYTMTIQRPDGSTLSFQLITEVLPPSICVLTWNELKNALQP